MAFELVFAAALIWLPPLQSVFHTTALPVTDVLVLAAAAPIMRGVDECVACTSVGPSSILVAPS